MRYRYIKRAVLGYTLTVIIIMVVLKTIINKNPISTSTAYDTSNDIFKDEYFYKAGPKDSFRFPEVNETQVMKSSFEDIGKMNTFYFLSDLGNLTQNDRGNSSSYRLFQKTISPKERHALLMLFQTFVGACWRHNVEFFLYGGTLLGSFRHHDMIPWDDDIDVMLNTSHRNQLREALSSTGPEFGLVSPPNRRWKFYLTEPKTLMTKSYRWPFIDIFFYMENETHISDEELIFRSAFSYPKQNVFPLVFRPFAGAFLPTPCKTQAVVEKNYSPSLCVSPTMSHKLESFLSKHFQATVPCKHLHRLYPFVRRRFTKTHILEDVYIRDRLVKTVKLPKDCGPGYNGERDKIL